MIKGMNHVGISVSNLDRSIEFYREMLGMELAGPIVPFAGPLFEQVMALQNTQGRIGFLRNGSLQLELLEVSHPNPARKDPNYSVADRGYPTFASRLRISKPHTNDYEQAASDFTAVQIAQAASKQPMAVTPMEMCSSCWTRARLRHAQRTAS